MSFNSGHTNGHRFGTVECKYLGGFNFANRATYLITYGKFYFILLSKDINTKNIGNDDIDLTTPIGIDANLS